MAIASHNVPASIKSRLKSPRLLIIEFILQELVDVGSPGQMLYMSLVPNYIKTNRNSIHYEQIAFNLKNSRVTDKHMASVSAIVKKLKKR